MPAASQLLGVALVVRAKDGPRFIFNYPPRLGSDQIVKATYGTELLPTTPDASDDEEYSDESDLEDDEYMISGEFDRLGIEKKDRHVSPWDDDYHFDLPDGKHIVPWEHVDAFETPDLASILTPAKDYHKKCFELTLDPLTFVTYPIHIREDGQWKKEKKEKNKRKKDGEEGSEVDLQTTVEATGDKPEGQQATAPVAVPESTQDRPNIPQGNSFVSDDGTDLRGMTMFNLVFIMNTPEAHAISRVKDMFEHVAKDLNKALRYAQAYSNYVWKESEMILTMKDKAREERRTLNSLWAAILQKSSLAIAIKNIYNAISTDGIAMVQFISDPVVRLSVQIPKPYFLSMPPEFDEISMPGVWITTANCLTNEDGDEVPVLNKHFALLLMEEEDKIIADIQTDGGELTGPLLEYLKIAKPTLSFHQTAQQHNISLYDIRLLAQHLIYHRRAIAIPPLHARDTYILSPNAPHRLLPSAIQTWRELFPLAPPLPNFLSTLSLAPRPYKSHFPSKAHAPIYISMLAFLLRNGWVTQLSTFAWVIAWPEIRYEVQHALDGERIRAALAAAEEALSSSSPSPSSSAAEIAAEKARLTRAVQNAAQDLAEFNALPLPVATASPSTNRAPHLVRLGPRLVRDPVRAEQVESLYLKAIAERFVDERSRKGWLRYVRYFDGATALESVALLEGVRRKEAWGLMFGWEEFLLGARHW